MRSSAAAGRDTGNAGDIDIGVDVAIRDAGLGQVAGLGLGVHAGPVGFLVPAGADVAVHHHGPSTDQARLIRGDSRHEGVYLSPAAS